MPSWPCLLPCCSRPRSGSAGEAASRRRAADGVSCPGQIFADVRAAVIGLGAVGARAARQLISTPDVDEIYVFDSDPVRLAEVGTALGERAVPLAGPEVDGHGVSVVVLATPAGEQLDLVRTHLERGAHVVSVSDSVEDVTALLALDGEARRRGVRLVVGAGFAPGLSCSARSSRRGDLRLDRRGARRQVRHGWARLRVPASSPRRTTTRRIGATAVWLQRRGGSGRETLLVPRAGWRPGLLPRGTG